MDFKVAGTADRITALQMDIKITGVTFRSSPTPWSRQQGPPVHPRQDGRAIDQPARDALKHAPRIEAIKIDREDRAVIGKGGETIRALCEEFEAEIDVEDDGTIRIYAPTGELVEACVARIESMTKEAEIGDRYNAAKVVKTTTFGAFVELVKGTDGLLHISNVKPGRGRLGRRRAPRRVDVTMVGRSRARPDRSASLDIPRWPVNPRGARSGLRRRWPAP
jgi:polyribonucleotide nucleotidyltransferase